MRHLEGEMQSSCESDESKRTWLQTFSDIKEFESLKNDIPPLFYEDFQSDEDNLSALNFDIKYDLDNDDFEQVLRNDIKKHRRKAAAPQRAFQADLSQSKSIDLSSESSQDEIQIATDGVGLINNELTDGAESMLDLEQGDILQEFEDQDIFKDLQEEADGENIDEEIIDNVKEEWKAHWGVKCNICELVFPFKAEFDTHYHLNYNLSPVYTCTFCNKTVDKYSTFRSHCYRHITEGRYKCKECAKGFSLQSMLHVHILAKHTKTKPFMCEECGRSFVTKPGLKIHLKKHKTELKEDYPCVECGKVLHTRGGLTSHMNVHRLGRRFMCDVCGKTFTQKVNMQQHVKQHTGDKPHSCGKCGKTFAEKSHLTRHYSFHSDQRPFKCDVCQKMYKTERCLKVHSLVHASARPFVCEYCNKGFLSSTKLKQHYNIHTGERPYKCKYCDRGFTNYPNWLKHIRRRHKVDHKTGADLNPSQSKEVVKEDAVATSAASPSADDPDQPPPVKAETVPNATDDAYISDVCLSKADELLLQEGFLNFPVADSKCATTFNQQLELLAANPGASIGTMGYLVPYFQTALPNQAIIQTTTSSVLPVPLQINDFISAGFVQQSCE
ncbi:zinc finger protein 726-like [Cylas formicarius]|uniref:zinc finger protein 726-like n=1 Tax=Cylas formicarius TaxID=197179 RepID=UPI002958CF65|nr:zinc finger protein 726-like [Cylas formicarius]